MAPSGSVNHAAPCSEEYARLQSWETRRREGEHEADAATEVGRGKQRQTKRTAAQHTDRDRAEARTSLAAAFQARDDGMSDPVTLGSW
jgi:hypothetical protein